MSQVQLLEADPHSVFPTVRAIVRAYLDNDFFGLITYGAPGSGKTRHNIKLLAQAYGVWEDARDKNGNKISIVRPEGMNWDAWKEWMKHTPEDFIGMIEYAHNKGRQQILGTLDDAGIAAANYSWQQELGRAINTYANVQRRDFACLDFTTPDPRWLLGHIRNMPGGHTAKVIRTTGNKYQRHLRRATIYRGWMAPDLKKSGVKGLWIDKFSIHLPQRVEEEFEPVNRKYAELAIEEVKKAYLKMKEKGKEKRAKQFRDEMEIKSGIKINTDEDKTA